MYGIIRSLWVLVRSLLLYGTGPMLLAFREQKPISRSMLFWSCVLCTAGALTAFSLLQYTILDIAPTDRLHALIWGSVFYDRSKRILRERGLLK